jgi:uncharacterized protein YndB with AHSA1/START domain
MTTTVHAERTITLVRVIKAPRELVWKAWTDAAMLKEWWGPENFTNPKVEGEVRVGGEMLIVMHGPKGSPWDINLPGVLRYREIVFGKKLVFGNDAIGPDGEILIKGLTSVTFEDHPDGTRLEVVTGAKAMLPQAVAMLGGMDQGWSQSLDRLTRLTEA